MARATPYVKVNAAHTVNVATATATWRASVTSQSQTEPVPHLQSELVQRARALAIHVLGDDPGLREHAARSAQHAARMARDIASSNQAEVTAAAWLHDIGYAPQLERTGFHPLDGALFLIRHSWPDRVVRLVAHHSLAAIEAPFYGVSHHLSAIEQVQGIDADILVSADLLGGRGDRTPSVQERLAAMREVDEAGGVVPADVRQERYAGLLSAHARVRALL